MKNYVKQTYNVPADIGRKVIVYRMPAIITADRGNYIGITYDHENPGIIHNAHPTDQVQYFEMGKIRKPTRSQKRYLDYLRSETSLTFGEYIGAIK